jgi:hypothetical protein
MYLSKLCHQPVAVWCLRDVARQRLALALEERHRQVAGQDVEERRDVGRALDRGVAAQRQDAAAGRPTLPSSSCRIAAVRMICTPTECCVHPTA